jgi:hypothetical protein
MTAAQLEKTLDLALKAEREKIAAWLECGDDCQHMANSGGCHRVDDFCDRYLAECIRNGNKP